MDLCDDTRFHHILHRDEDIVSRVAVERCAQPLLVKMVANETDATAKNKETVEGSNLDVLVSFLASERATITEQIDEADGNATIDVEDELK